MDTQDFTTSVTHLIFTPDTHINDSRQRSSQRTVSCFQPWQTALMNSTKPTKATDYNAIAQHIAIQNGSSHLTREQKICYHFNSLILYVLYGAKILKVTKAQPHFFCKTHSTVSSLNISWKKQEYFTNLTRAQSGRVSTGSLSHVFSELNLIRVWFSISLSSSPIVYTSMQSTTTTAVTLSSLWHENNCPPPKQ